MSHAYTEEVIEACEEVGAQYQLIKGEQAKAIYEAIDNKFFTQERADERWEKRNFALEYTTRGGTHDAWRHIRQLTQGEPIYLMFNYDRDSNLFFFEDSSLISEILGGCFGFVFYISDIDLSYLIFEDFDEVLVAAGEKAIQRVRSYNFDEPKVIGAVRYQSKWRIFEPPVHSWVLNYCLYNPKLTALIDPNVHEVTQNNLLEVDETNAENFLTAIETYETFPDQIRDFLEAGYDDELSVVIDFDNKVYNNNYPEIPLQNYIPSHWTVYQGSPLDYVPDDIRAIWEEPLPAA
jgi:hypothetical protein